jgi:hypothetical protein
LGGGGAYSGEVVLGAGGTVFCVSTGCAATGPHSATVRTATAAQNVHCVEIAGLLTAFIHVECQAKRGGSPERSYGAWNIQDIPSRSRRGVGAQPRSAERIPVWRRFGKEATLSHGA